VSYFKTRRLENDLANANSYGEWKDVAQTLDRLEGKDQWLGEESSALYSHRLIRNRLNELRQLRKKDNVPELVFWLHEGLHGNLGNMANEALYSQTRVGTKPLITQYINEVVEVLEYLASHQFDDFGYDAKIRFFKRVAKCFGRSGLLFSGGATLGMFHIGVSKALWEHNLLPRVVSGSSAGSIIASAMATRTDDEFLQFLDPEYLYLQAFAPNNWKSLVDEKAVLSGKQLEHCLQENLGDLTFAEAFERTGRILNIPISPVASNQMPRLMNYLTGPNVLIRTASLASCSIPGIFPPAKLMGKNFDGSITPYLPSLRWADGSLKSDLPMLRMARLHDVNHYIVSQTNPHIAPFLHRAAESERKKGVLPFAKDLVTGSLQAQGKHVLATAQNHVSQPFIKRVLGEAHSILNQNYRGDITIIPRFDPIKMAKVLTNPTPEDIESFIIAGERETWPQMERIRNASIISQTLEDCIRQLKIEGRQQPTGPSIKRASFSAKSIIEAVGLQKKS
jgi:TAG lipase/steryl ester hydrolase/phospholipase A2/LPA acyltransferase